MKWSATTMMQDETKVSDDSETRGQAGVKFWRYTIWQMIEKTRWTRGSESKKYRRTWIVMMICQDDMNPMHGPTNNELTYIAR
jgi:hypothetical protein